MFLAGVDVRGDLVLEIARNVDDTDLAGRLESAYGRDVRIFGLTIAERETLLRTLEEPPKGLEELCAVLLSEHVGRKQEGL